MGNVFTLSLDLSCCLNCIIAEAKYVSKLPDNLASLKTEKQNLVRLRDDVIVKINLAEQRRMKPTNQVQGWLHNVEKLVVEVNQLLTAESQETEKLCLGSFCSKNCKSSYKYGKLVRQKLQLVDTLKKQHRDFGDNVADRVPEPPGRKLPTEPTILGQEYLFHEVWRYISEKKGSMIGLFGTGGVGKTTLLTRINNKLCDEQQLHFDAVIWTAVSKELRLEKIQEDIGKRIGLWDEVEKWKQKTLHEKAQDIFETLSEKRFVLLLDDIWEPVNLKEVGVPNPDPNNSSKVIFTTRFEDVCGKMDARGFRVKCLGGDQAWELFRQNLQGVMLDGRPDILGLAKEVAKECGGLPLVIKTIARAMSCNTTPEEWDFAIQVLKRPAPEYVGVDKFSDMKNVFHCLKFSYDRLRDDNIKSCFKYCCLFPEDCLISKRELINCWIGEGFLNEFGGSVFINQGYTIINTLLRACLLEEQKNDCVKMHDVIRDMALWISCEVEKENENVFICASAGLTKTVGPSKWEGVTRMSLMNNRIENLPDAPRCPSLTTLFLNGNRIVTIPHDFFQYMSSLRVLNLSDNYPLKKLPSGISKLVLLEYLNLRDTGIKELPEELKALVNLKCLILEETPICMIPTKLISGFSRLQVLRLPLYGNSVLYNEYGEFSANELVPLEHLSVLSITIRRLSSLQEIFSTACPKLQRCTLQLAGFNSAKSFDILSVADVECLDELLLSFGVLEELKINCAWNTVEKMHEFQGFKNLQRVTIRCAKLREATWLIFARNIRALTIEGCHELEEVISYEKLGEASEITEDLYPFSKLEFLTLRRANKLKSIYWKALPFPQLEEITVTWCRNLKKLPLDSNSTREHKVVIRGGRRWWKELEWEDQPTQIAFQFSS